MSYIKSIIADLEQQRNKVEATYRAARIAWEKESKIQHELLERDQYSIECSEASR